METGKPGNCYTCELIARRDAGIVPPWDAILRTDYWDIVHAYNTSLPGWLVLVLRRHANAIADMTQAEANELGSLIRSVSLALRNVTGCSKTYVAQFAEQAEHPHVHFHIIPRMADQPEAYHGTHIFDLLGVPFAERVSEDKMNEIAFSIRQELRPDAPGSDQPILGCQCP